ncbi:hypothetical protein NM208_g14626 [Fusarium decemcellulare]|uniref:Uncharacterized protein n=1 Tax=Fusarium decemcellulare TaxID=57161 RepID=A0ACC1RHW6_9HYPO|nr:hypothetical protein NM208_g14626 [Fusarium decemcellulare]
MHMVALGKIQRGLNDTDLGWCPKPHQQNFTVHDQLREEMNEMSERHYLGFASLVYRRITVANLAVVVESVTVHMCTYAPRIAKPAGRSNRQAAWDKTIWWFGLKPFRDRRVADKARNSGNCNLYTNDLDETLDSALT